MDASHESTRWERWTPTVPLVMLVLASAVAVPTAVLFGVDTPGWLLAQACLVLASAAWSWWWVLRRRERGQTPAAQNIHLLGRTVLAFVLTWINPFFGIYAWVGYLDLGEIRNRWVRRIGLVGVAVTLAGSQSGGFPPASRIQWLVFAVLLVVNLGLAGMLGHLQLQNTRRAEEQRAMIVELGRVNADLERAARENAALHDTVVAQARRAGVQDERQRLAREIHDTIAQSLAAILAQLQAAQHDPDPAARLSRATDLVRGTLGEARRSVMDLAPGPLASTRLVDAVSALVQDWSQDRPEQADVTVVGEVRTLHPEVEATVLRIAQEALTNVGKHAGAGRVGVTVTYDDEQIALDVRDDGIGFDPATSVTDSSFGLRGMRQRAARLAGTLDVETAADQGTAVSVHLPALSREAAA
jgi:signal transduction histidine kinase